MKKLNKTEIEKITAAVSDSINNIEAYSSLKPFLKVMEIEYENKKPKIIAIKERKEEKDYLNVFVKIKDEDFYLVFVINKSDYEVCQYVTFPKIEIFYSFTNNKKTKENILKSIKLVPDFEDFLDESSTNNGPFIKNYCWTFKADNEPGEMEELLDDFLDRLYKDEEGIKALAKNRFCDELTIYTTFHIGNGEVTGTDLTNNQLKRIANLGLKVIYVLYPQGRLIKGYM